MKCSFCERETDGNFLIHRDGFGVGPEVPLCAYCAASTGPSCVEIWNKIAHPSHEIRRLLDVVQARDARIVELEQERDAAVRDCRTVAERLERREQVLEAAEARIAELEQEQKGCLNCHELNNGGYETEDVGPFCADCWSCLHEDRDALISELETALQIYRTGVVDSPLPGRTAVRALRS